MSSLTGSGEPAVLLSNLSAINVLMVEDDPDDVYLTRQALRASRLSINLDVLDDGRDALEYLRGSGRYAGRSRPNLVLLDLNLPGKDGREVLSEIKNDPALADIPVVILTTSKAEQDIASSYREHANCYISKPVDMEQFREVVSSIENFWFTVVQFPLDPGQAGG